MEPGTQRALAAINHRFYHGHAAADFSRTRGRPWAGFRPIVPQLPAVDRQHVLDVGCGNGRLATFLAEELQQPISYHGIDESEVLLTEAAEATRRTCPDATFERCELAESDAGLPSGPFTCIAAIALLHHIPGAARREQLVRSLAHRLSPNGILVLTAWRFDRIAALRRRRTPWAEGLDAMRITLDPGDLEPGDELIAWGSGTGQLRYCNLLDDTRFGRLIEASGLQRAASYAADGRGGDHNEYAILRRDLVSPR